MIDLSNPMYQKLFIDLAYLRFENVDNEKGVITVEGVEHDMTDPAIALVIESAKNASKEIYDVIASYHSELFEPSQGRVH